MDYPLDICLTEFHLLLLYTNRLAAISLLDRTLAFEDFYTVSEGPYNINK